MSIASAREFLKNIAKNSDLYDQINQAKNSEDKLRVAATAGYVFTRDEFREAANELSAEEYQNLTGYSVKLGTATHDCATCGWFGGGGDE